jgi:hypothetical protein
MSRLLQVLVMGTKAETSVPVFDRMLKTRNKIRIRMIRMLKVLWNFVAYITVCHLEVVCKSHIPLFIPLMTYKPSS